MILQIYSVYFYQKLDPGTGVLVDFWEIFQNTFFIEPRRTDAYA